MSCNTLFATTICCQVVGIVGHDKRAAKVILSMLMMTTEPGSWTAELQKLPYGYGILQHSSQLPTCHTSSFKSCTIMFCSLCHYSMLNTVTHVYRDVSRLLFETILKVYTYSVYRQM